MAEEKIELRTTKQLKKEDVEHLEIISDEAFADIVDSIILNDYRAIPNSIRLPNLNEQLSEKLGLEKNSAFIIKKRATHIRPDRKGSYSQAFSVEEYRAIPSVMRNATFAVVDERLKNFQIVFDDELNPQKINKLVFNKDELGNYLVTLGKVNRYYGFSEKFHRVVGVGVAPTISRLRQVEGNEPATRLRPSPTTDYSIQEKKNLSTEKTQDLNTLNSPLPVNAECAFERKFRVNNYLDLTGMETVQNAADVAFIFKNLRDEAVENTFAVFVKDKKPTVVHLSIGNANSAFIPPDIISLAAKKIQPDEMYFVHNHPGGNVEPSEYDLETLEAIKKIVRMNPENEKLPVHNIIVNGFSNTYSYIEDKKEFEIEKGRIEDKEFAGNIPIYSVDKRVFNKDFECPQKISSPADVAEYIYSHRLGERKNLNALLLDGTACVGNLCLFYSEIKGNEKKIASDLVAASAQFTANKVIVFGNDHDLFDQVLQLKKTLRESGMDYLLADAVVADGKSSYSSAAEHGLLTVAEPEEKYETKENDMEKEASSYQTIETPEQFIKAAMDAENIVVPYDIADLVANYGFDGYKNDSMRTSNLALAVKGEKIVSSDLFLFADVGTFEEAEKAGIVKEISVSEIIDYTQEHIQEWLSTDERDKERWHPSVEALENFRAGLIGNKENEIDPNKVKIYLDYENKKIAQMYYNGDGGYFVKLENSFEQLADVLEEKPIEDFDTELEGLAVGYPIHTKSENPEEYARDLDEWNNKAADIEYDFMNKDAKRNAAVELAGEIAAEFGGRNFGEVGFFDSIKEAINGDTRKLESLELEEHFGRIHRIHTNVASLHDLDKVTDRTFDNMEWLGDEFRYTIYPDDETFESFVGESIDEFCENNNISPDFMANRIKVSMTDGNVEAYYLIYAEGQNVFEKNVTEELFFEGSSAYTPAMLKEFRKEVLPEMQMEAKRNNEKEIKTIEQFNSFFKNVMEKMDRKPFENFDEILKWDEVQYGYQDGGIPMQTQIENAKTTGAATLLQEAMNRDDTGLVPNEVKNEDYTEDVLPKETAIKALQGDYSTLEEAVAAAAQWRSAQLKDYRESELINRFNDFFGTTFENAKEAIFTSSYGDPSENVTLEDALIDIAQDKLLDDWREDSGIRLPDEPEGVYEKAHEFASLIVTGASDVSNTTYERVLEQFEEQIQSGLDAQKGISTIEQITAEELNSMSRPEYFEAEDWVNVKAGKIKADSGYSTEDSLDDLKQMIEQGLYDDELDDEKFKERVTAVIDAKQKEFEQQNSNEKENTMSDEMKTLQDLQSRINEQKAKQAELQNKEDSLNSSQEELWQKSFDAFREKVLELKAYIPTKKHSFDNRFDEKNYPIIVSKFENKFEKNGSWDICFNKDGQLVVYKSYDSFDGHSYSFGITDLHFKNSEETKPEKRNFKRVCYEQNLAEKITGIVTEYAQKNLESLAKQNEEKAATLEQKQAYLSKYTAPESNEPMQSVQSLEQFFGREFSSAELVRAIEEMEFYSDEIKSAYSLENDPNAERTYVFGTIAANAIIDIHEEKGMKLNDAAAEEIYKIGVEVAQNKYGSYSELEPKLEKIFGNEKNIRPYPKDMRNLEKALESFYSQQSQIEDGKIAGVFTNVWVDNWRIISPLTNENGYPINESTITYKGVESIKCANGEAVCINAKALEAAKLNVGDVLKTVAEANDLKCPQFDIGVYKPSQNYYIDKMNIKEREFYKNPPYPGFAAQMERVKEMAKNTLENNGMLRDYKLMQILPKSRHPDDKELSCVMAKNEQTGKYAVWTSFNTDASANYGSTGSLNRGHYDIKNLNDAAKIMCAVSDSRPVHIEHRQQVKRGNDVER